MRRQVTDGLIIATVLVLGASQLGAQGVASRKVVRANQAGGITGSAAHAVRGPNGGAMLGGRAVVTDGSGNAAGGSAQAIQGPNGAAGARASGVTRSADGSVERQSGGAASGAAGSASSRGSMQKNADGTVSGSRDTGAQAASGATYDGSTTYDQGSGVSHTGTCTNAAGDVVACAK